MWRHTAKHNVMWSSVVVKLWLVQICPLHTSCRWIKAPHPLNEPLQGRLSAFKHASKILHNLHKKWWLKWMSLILNYISVVIVREFIKRNSIKWSFNNFIFRKPFSYIVQLFIFTVFFIYKKGKIKILLILHKKLSLKWFSLV